MGVTCNGAGGETEMGEKKEKKEKKEKRNWKKKMTETKANMCSRVCNGLTTNQQFPSFLQIPNNSLFKSLFNPTKYM